MARAGIHKSEVMRARDTLLAQGKHPSIDAVRATLGNTGSKTTIQRYLRELEEEDGAGRASSDMQVSDTIQDLVKRLAARLQEEAESRVVELRRQYDGQLQNRDEALTLQRQEIEALGTLLQRTEASLRDEKLANDEARQVLAGANTANERLTQQVADLSDRLKDNEAHRLSLEEKHQHAREALEHYRQSVKDQREQEQRRHEHQVQQLQIELRTLNQTVIVKQNELTQLYQDTAKVTAELAAIKKDLRRVELEAGSLREGRDQLQQRAGTLEANAAALSERLEQSEAKCTSAEQMLAEQLSQLHGKELELVQLRTRLASQEELLSLMKAAYPAANSDKIREGETIANDGDR
ncbi:MAG: DNA-binding protein [Chitinimonas sp.]|nr:DNA-binding protein [Chitinimonas sp.]